MYKDFILAQHNALLDAKKVSKNIVEHFSEH
jgi:hypothetical protein